MSEIESETKQLQQNLDLLEQTLETHKKELIAENERKLKAL